MPIHGSVDADEAYRRAALGADVLRALTTTPDLVGRLQGCAEAIVRHADAAFARIWTLDEENQVLDLVASAGQYTHLDGDHGRVPVGQFKIGRIAESGRPHLTNDVARDPAVSDPLWARREGMVAFAGYPLSVEGGRVVGVCALFARHRLSPDVLDALADVAVALAVGVDRERIWRERERLVLQLAEQRRLLEAVLQQMPAGVIIAEAPSGKLLLANRVVGEFLEHPLVTGTIDDAAVVEVAEGRADPPGFDDWPLGRAIRSGDSVHEEEIRFRLNNGRMMSLLASAAPVRDGDGAVIAGVGTFVDVTARRRTERLSRLQHESTRVLADAATLDAASGPLLEGLAGVLECAVACLWLVDAAAGVLRNEAVWHSPEQGSIEFEQLCRATTFAPGRGLPGLAWEAGRPQWVSDLGGDPSFPRSVEAQRSGLHHGFAVPVFAGQQTVGVIEFFWTGLFEFDPEMLAVLATVATQLGQFIERTRAEAALRASEARKAAILASALDCVVSIDGAGRLIEFNPAAEETFGYRREDVIGALIHEIIIPASYRAAHLDGLATYLRTGDGPMLGQRLELEAMRSDGSVFPVELAIVPINTPGEVSFTAYLRDITARKTVERSLVEGRERMAHLAHTLQESLIPPAPASIPGVDVAGVYRPAGLGDEVGGDFYDVFETARGDWAVALGDVCGKGAEAAVVTALARYTIRAAAMQTRRPSQVLATLNRAVLRQHPDRFCTAIYARVRPQAGRVRLTITAGGHPLPLRVSQSGHVSSVGRWGSLIGVIENAVLHDTQVDLHPGEVVVFFTDGVTEGRSDGEFYGDERLRALLGREAAGDAAAIAKAIVDDVVQFQAGNPRDDIAVVVLKVPEDPPASTSDTLASAP